MLISPLEVLEVQSNERDSGVAFLDEFRIVIPRYDGIEDTSNLVVFDTRIPQSCPEDFQRFELPWRYICGPLHVRVDCDRPLGMDIREEPFTVDPAQAVFLVEFSLMCRRSGSRVLLAVRTTAFIGRTGSYFPWEEWGGDSVVLEISLGRSKMSTFVRGVHLVVVICVRRYCCLWTFDLSKRGCHALPVLIGMGSVGEKRLVLEDSRDVLLKGIRTADMDPANMSVLGDGTVVYPASVSYAPRFSEDGTVG